MSVSGLPVQERHELVGQRRAKGCKNSKGSGMSLQQRKAERAGLFSLRKGSLREDLQCTQRAERRVQRQSLAVSSGTQ